MARLNFVQSFVLISSFFLSAFVVHAQTFECAVEPPEESPCYQGDCDDWEFRDDYQLGESTPFLTIRLAFIVYRDDNGDFPAVTESSLNAQFEQLLEDFDDYKIAFNWINPDPEDYYVDDTHFLNFASPPRTGYQGYCPDPGSATCSPSQYEEAAMKLHGVTELDLDPPSTLLVYITETSIALGDWPWFDDLGTYLHGVMIAGSNIGGVDCGPFGLYPCRSLSHEIGHTLGLYHTYAGWEFQNSESCCEPSSCDGPGSDLSCNEVGDLCSDTPANRDFSGCGTHSGNNSCGEEPEPWPTNDYENIMGDGFETCWDHFTPQQARRMHCWVCNAVPEWIDSPDCNSNEIPDVCELTRGDKDDCDANGVPDDCQPDCNNNFVADVCDIAEQISNDCDGNGVPDECHSSTQQRACCHDGDQCTVMTELCCDELSGVFVEGQSTCLYGPCAMFGP